MMKVLNRKHAMAPFFVLAAIVVCRPLPSLPETSPGEITFGPGPFDLLDPAALSPSAWWAMLWDDFPWSYSALLVLR